MFAAVNHIIINVTMVTFTATTITMIIIATPLIVILNNVYWQLTTVGLHTTLRNF